MKKKKIFFLLISLIFIAESKSEKPILFVGATTHVGNGNVIANSIVSIHNGKFEIIGNASSVRIDPSAFDTIFKVYDKHIYPSFILPNTTLGLTEVSAVRATRDYKEVGKFNPHVRTLIAYNTDSKIPKTILNNGIMIAQVTPRGGTISGKSSIMHLDGHNWEDAQLKADDGIHLNWPKSFYSTGWWAEPGKIKMNENYKERIEEINHLFEKAWAYHNSTDNSIDVKLESMLGLFDGTTTLFIHSSKANDMRDAIKFAKKYSIKKIVIVGAEDALKIVNLLKKENISLILKRVHRLPITQDRHIDEPYSQAKKLQNEGVLFCLSYDGDMEAMGSRNLPFTAGTTVAYGQEYEDAVMSISLNTAKVLGIDHMVGSIEKGKDATFFISSGDALDIKSNNVERVFIRGEEIDLLDHQKKLYYEYKK